MRTHTAPTSLALRRLAECHRDCGRLVDLLNRSVHLGSPSALTVATRAQVERIGYILDKPGRALTQWSSALDACHEAAALLRKVDDPEINYASERLHRSLVSFAKICKLIQAERMHQVKVSRRTRFATGLALRLLPSEDRARYCEEFAAELADVPRSEQQRYAVRLARQSWALRRSLVARRRSRTTITIILSAGVVGEWRALDVLGWPAAVVFAMLVPAAMWVLNSQERTRRLASLMRAARSGPPQKRP